jgi:Tol biopolymer transport system component
LFLREGTLMAQPFDAKRLQLAGDPVAVAEQIGSWLSFGWFAASANGTLIYRTGGGSAGQTQWLDRQGKSLGPVGEPGVSSQWNLSPDGTRLAQVRQDGGNADVWVVELARGVSTRLTFDPALDQNPVWSPDGKRIAFASNRGGQWGLYVKPSNGSAEEQLLLQSAELKAPTSWSSDGRYLLYSMAAPKTQDDIWVLPLEGDKKPFLFLGTPFREGFARFSADSRWIAYTSEESGAPEVYVRPFVPPGEPSKGAADAGGKWMVSKGGGINPRWRRDGKELFYFRLDGSMMSVEVKASPVFEAGVPQRLFGANLLTNWDVSADGQRFLMLLPQAQAGGVAPFTVVQNWQAALKK